MIYKAMNGHDLFRKLGVGAKFDFKRFQVDAQKLKVGRPVEKVQDVHGRSSLDFFKEEKVSKERKRKASVGPQDVKKQRGDSDESESDADEEEDEGNSDESSVAEEEEEEEELTLLGTMKSGDQKLAKTVNKKRKKTKKHSADKRASIKQEEINHLRKMSRIHVQGTDIVDPVTSFEALVAEGLNPRVVENLHALGFTEPTPIQMQAIPFMMQRREMLACAPTGSGKTAAFVLPIIHHLKEPRKMGFRALILSPTRELATQTYRVFSQIAGGTGFRIHYIDKTTTAAKKFGPDSSQKFDPSSSGWHMGLVLKALCRCASPEYTGWKMGELCSQHVLVTTPNRLVHMLQQEPPAISLKNIEWLIVDESDKLFEEGKRGFRDQLAAVYQACDGRHVRRAMFSATFAHDVEQWCKLHLDNVVQVYVGAKNSATDTIDQELMFVGGESGKRIAIRSIIQKGLTPPVLIFVQSKDRAKELFHELIYDGINVDVIHSDRTQLQRDNIVKSFRTGRVWVLICTDLMGRGIDFKGVNLVINYDLPTSAISYIHRVGRTGRAGRPGRAVTLFTEADAVNLRSIVNVLKMSGGHVPDYMMKLAAPRKNDRRKLAKSAPIRKSISTVPKYEVKRENDRKKHVKRLLNGPKHVCKGDKKPETPHPRFKSSCPVNEKSKTLNSTPKIANKKVKQKSFKKTTSNQKTKPQVGKLIGQSKKLKKTAKQKK